MSGDILERLRRLDDWLAGSGTAADELLEAADEIVRLRAEVERLRAAGDALAEAFEALRDEHDACWCPDPRTEMFGTCQLCAAEEGWQEARREQ